jgi:hypothetical protein
MEPLRHWLDALTARVGHRRSPREGPVCGFCGDWQHRMWRPSDDRDALICDPCLDLLNDILDACFDLDRERWLAQSVADTCSVGGGLGKAVGGMIAKRANPPAFVICEGCVTLANALRASNREPVR